MSNLERIFKQTFLSPKGNCPLPEPGPDATKIEHVSFLSVHQQPEGYNYDRVANDGERIRFANFVEELIMKGEISKKEAQRILDSV